MHFYQAFGLRIRSDLPLPELTQIARTDAEVVIRLGELPYPSRNRDHLTNYCEVTPEGALCVWNQMGSFWVQGGREITIERSPWMDEDIIRLLLLGPVSSVLLYQRGLLVLHASAIECLGAAIVFIGAKGRGKSTIAASLYARGNKLLADDVVAVKGSNGKECQESLAVLPGFPQLKLWPDSVALALGDDPGSLPQLAVGYEKSARRVVDGFSEFSPPLKQLYVLFEGPVPRIKSLPPQVATILPFQRSCSLVHISPQYAQL